MNNRTITLIEDDRGYRISCTVADKCLRELEVKMGHCDGASGHHWSSDRASEGRSSASGSGLNCRGQGPPRVFEPVLLLL